MTRQEESEFAKQIKQNKEVEALSSDGKSPIKVALDDKLTQAAASYAFSKTMITEVLIEHLMAQETCKNEDEALLIANTIVSKLVESAQFVCQYDPSQFQERLDDVMKLDFSEIALLGDLFENSNEWGDEGCEFSISNYEKNDNSGTSVSDRMESFLKEQSDNCADIQLKEVEEK